MARKWLLVSKDGIWASHAEVSAEGIDGKVRKVSVALRIDARDKGALRVDMHTLGPWEAIDGGVPQRTLISAKVLAERWVSAANAQKTLHPRV